MVNRMPSSEKGTKKLFGVALLKSSALFTLTSDITTPPESMRNRPENRNNVLLYRLVSLEATSISAGINKSKLYSAEAE
jgi:hypothetical protein